MGASVYPATTKHLLRVLNPNRSSSSSWHGGSKIACPLCRKNREKSPSTIVVVQSPQMV